MTTDNLNDSQLRDLLRRVRILETTQPVGYTSVSEGALRIVSDEGLIVEGSESVTGTLTVSGTLTLSGTLNADGTITFTGPVTIAGATDITGPLKVTGDTGLNGDTTVNGPLHVKGATDIAGDTTVNGPFHVKGATDITGTLGIKGASTLEGDLNITGAGKISSGVLFIDSGGEVNSSDVLQLNGSSAVTLRSFEISAYGNFTAVQILSNPGIFSTSGVTANVYVDDNGRFWKVA